MAKGDRLFWAAACAIALSWALGAMIRARDIEQIKRAEAEEAVWRG